MAITDIAHGGLKHYQLEQAPVWSTIAILLVIDALLLRSLDVVICLAE